MRLKRYRKYKDSGVEWLGEVPRSWGLCRLGTRFVERREKVSDTDYSPLSVTKKGIVPQLDTAAKTDDGDNRKKVCCGDFVINSRSDRKGSSGLASQEGSVSLINIVLEPFKIERDFIRFLLKSVPFQEEFYRNGKGIVADLWSTHFSEMKDILLPLPSVEEQTAIATYLDRETAKIDALIAEKQRLLSLLKEKRQALISHAVTKGLDPNAPMKDSGIEWLGMVPEHWKIAPLKKLFSIVGGSTPKSDIEAFWEGEISWITPSDLSNLTSMYIDDSGRKITREGLESCGTTLVPPQTIILSTRAPIGSLAIAKKTCCTNQGCKSLVPKIMKETKFFGYLLGIATEELNIRGKGTTFLELSGEELSNFEVPAPSLAEQTAIVAYLDRETTKIDTLIAESDRAIGLLQERRASLISAAVTGKIDVRHLISREAS